MLILHLPSYTYHPTLTAALVLLFHECLSTEGRVHAAALRILLAHGQSIDVKGIAATVKENQLCFRDSAPFGLGPGHHEYAGGLVDFVTSAQPFVVRGGYSSVFFRGREQPILGTRLWEPTARVRREGQ